MTEERVGKKYGVDLSVEGCAESGSEALRWTALPSEPGKVLILQGF